MKHVLFGPLGLGFEKTVGGTKVKILPAQDGIPSPPANFLLRGEPNFQLAMDISSYEGWQFVVVTCDPQGFPVSHHGIQYSTPHRSHR